MRLPHYPRGPRRAAPNGWPLGTQASGPQILSRVALSGDRPGTRPGPPPTSRRVAPPPLPGPGFLPHGARARRPPGSRLACSLQARCQVPAPPRATAQARPRLFLLSPSPPGPPSIPGNRGQMRQPGSRAPRRCPPSPHRHARRLAPPPPPPRSIPTLPEGSLPGGRCLYSLLFPPISPPLRTRLETDLVPLNEGSRLPED